MRIRTKKSRLIRTIILWVLIVITLLAGGYSLYRFLTRDINPLPPPIRSQLGFSPFVIPKDTKGFMTSSYKYTKAEANVSILTYVIAFSGRTVTMSEYTQPAQFTEIPDFKTTFLSNAIKQYATVESSNGTVYLGRLSKQNNAQVGVMIERGLIVFLRPDAELTEAQWRQLGDQFVIQKAGS